MFKSKCTRNKVKVKGGTNKVKKQKRKLFFLVILIFILGIFFFQMKRKGENLFQDDLIFFKLFSIGEQNHSNLLKTKELDTTKGRIICFRSIL